MHRASLVLALKYQLPYAITVYLPTGIHLLIFTFIYNATFIETYYLLLDFNNNLCFSQINK